MSLSNDFEEATLFCRFLVRAYVPHVLVVAVCYWWVASTLEWGVPVYFDSDGGQIDAHRLYFPVDGEAWYGPTDGYPWNLRVPTVAYPEGRWPYLRRCVALAGVFLFALYITDVFITGRRAPGRILRRCRKCTYWLLLMLALILCLALVVLRRHAGAAPAIYGVSPIYEAIHGLPIVEDIVEWLFSSRATSLGQELLYFLVGDCVILTAYLLVMTRYAHGTPPLAAFRALLESKNDERLQRKEHAEAKKREKEEAQRRREQQDAERRREAEQRKAAREQLMLTYTEYMAVVHEIYTPAMMQQYVAQFMGDERSVADVQRAGVRLAHQLKEMYLQEKPKHESLDARRRELTARIEACNQDIAALHRNDEISPYQLQEALAELEEEKRRLQQRFNANVQ